MATVHRDDIARLMPVLPPGATVERIHSAAREIWPGISLDGVLGLVASLIHDGRAVRVDATEGAHRYHLTETS